MLFTLLGQPEGEPISGHLQPAAQLDDEGAIGPAGGPGNEPPELAAGDLEDLQPLHLHQRTPLWFYILLEAEVIAGGEHLGPVGGRIVAEVIVGLIKGDRQSYLRQAPD